MGNYRGHSGNGNGSGGGWFRLALLLVQLVLIGGFPITAFIAEIRGIWQLNDHWLLLYATCIVGPVLVSQGLLRLPELTATLSAWADCIRALRGQRND